MTTFVKIIIGVAIVGGLFALFLTSFLLNKKVAKPAGCEEAMQQCRSCSVTRCAHNKQNVKEEE